MKTEYLAVQREVMRAYTDCWSDADFDTVTKHQRSLDYTALTSVPRDVAIEIMSKATPNGYNEFSADKLKFLPKDSQVRIAREASVCV